MVAAKTLLTKDQAESITQQIVAGLDDLLELVLFAYHGEADRALGYTSWGAYVRARFPSLPRFAKLEDRQNAEKILLDGGLSNKATGAVLGVSDWTVRNDLPARNLAGRSTSKEGGKEVRTAEISDEEKRERAIELAAQGWSYRQIGPEVGLDESQVRRDPEVRKASAAARPEIVSKTNYTNSVVCRIYNASEVISSMERDAEDLVGPKYTLSRKDIRRLRKLATQLVEALDILEGN